MKPEMILQSNLLDILFDNRNKDYGAYDLRSKYNGRLAKSIFTTASVVLLFSISWYVKANYFTEKQLLSAPPVIDVVMTKTAMEHKSKTEVEKKASAKSSVKQIANPVYRIVADDSADKKLPTNVDLGNAHIGLVTTSGDNDSGYVKQPGGTSDTGTAMELAKPVIEERTEPYTAVQFMPEFPGGSDAFLKFMLRNLKEADDLEEGDKVVVNTRFVVEPNGEIDHIEILSNSGRYDAEVIRVIKKMPQWKPGIQNGNAVPVYLSLPVTFQGKD